MREKTCNAEILRENTYETRLLCISGITELVCLAWPATQCVTVTLFSCDTGSPGRLSPRLLPRSISCAKVSYSYKCSNAHLTLQILFPSSRQICIANFIFHAEEICNAICIYTSAMLLQCVEQCWCTFQSHWFLFDVSYVFSFYQMQKCLGLEDCEICHADLAWPLNLYCMATNSLSRPSCKMQFFLCKMQFLMRNTQHRSTKQLVMLGGALQCISLFLTDLHHKFPDPDIFAFHSFTSTFSSNLSTLSVVWSWNSFILSRCHAYQLQMCLGPLEDCKICHASLAC